MLLDNNVKPKCIEVMDYLVRTDKITGLLGLLYTEASATRKSCSNQYKVIKEVASNKHCYIKRLSPETNKSYCITDASEKITFQYILHLMGAI